MSFDLSGELHMRDTNGNLLNTIGRGFCDTRDWSGKRSRIKPGNMGIIIYIFICSVYLYIIVSYYYEMNCTSTAYLLHYY